MRSAEFAFVARTVATLVAATVLFFGLANTTSAANIDCLDTDAALTYWRPVREAASTTEQPVDTLALEVVSCLGSPNRELRDRIAYELLTYWLRQEKISTEVRRKLLQDLSIRVADSTPESTLSRSFSALILSEIMRSDSISPFMNSGERQVLLETTIAAIADETDFRGLDEDLGWVHPVAHMADLLWRFALHDETTSVQAKRILDGVRSKVAPTSAAYSFNEGDRLARAVTILIRRELLAPEEFVLWIEQFSSPRSMEKWTDAFLSPAGMAELHNTKLFLRALADQLNDAGVDAAVTEALDGLVQGFTELI
jgi:hypothetical protein